MNVETPLVPGAPVTLADLIDAARIPLRMYQRNNYIAWRETRWYSDTTLASEIKTDRQRWRYRRNAYAHLATIFSLPIAQDVLIAALPYSPETTIARLDTMGVSAEDTPDDEFAAALGLLNRPALHVALRESRFPLVEVRVALKVITEDTLALMFAAGMSADEILDLAYAGGPLPAADGLRMLVALRGAPTTD